MLIGTTVVGYTFCIAYSGTQPAVRSPFLPGRLSLWQNGWHDEGQCCESGFSFDSQLPVWVWHADTNMLKFEVISLFLLFLWLYDVIPFLANPTWLLIPRCLCRLGAWVKTFLCEVVRELHLLTSPAVRGLESRTFSFDQALPVCRCRFLYGILWDYNP